MQCKAETKSGTRCKRVASNPEGFCSAHRPSQRTTLHCSFCHKSQHEVYKLIAGPGAYICDECADLCIEILWEDQPKDAKYLSITKKLTSNTQHNPTLEELGLKPRFNTLKFQKKENHCFYLCPFNEPFNTIYSDHVQPLIRSIGFTVERADEIFGTTPIIEDIWESINSAEFIIADLTDKNPNVMYEVGMAHTIGKPVIIMTQDITDVPFDLKHHRCIIYDYTPKGVANLEKRLEGTLNFLKARR